MSDLLDRVHVTTDPAGTEELGRQIASLLEPGWVVMLRGSLGAGKTTFVRGLAEGLGVPPDEVSSPTFTLVQRYDGRLTLYHVDLYRIDHAAEVDELGLEEFLASGAVVVVEWAERLPRPCPVGIDVRLEDAGGDCRRITVSPVRAPAHSMR